MSTIRLLCAGFTLLVALLLVACSSSGPETAVQDFVNAVIKQDVDKVVGLCALGDVPENRMLQAKGKIQMMVGRALTQVEANGGFKRLDIVESTIADDGETATVRATLVFNNGKEDTSTIPLRREDGKWKVILR